MREMTSWEKEWRGRCGEAWEISEEHGFHDGYEIGTKLCLMHSELSEALEALRHGNPPSEKIPEFTHVEEEIADLLIRVMDEAATQKWDIAGAIDAKMAYNKGRPFKHGKKF